MGAVGLVFGAKLRRYWRSWLLLSLLIAIVGGFVLAAIAAGVLVTANVLAAIPALSAARARPGRVLRTE